MRVKMYHPLGLGLTVVLGLLGAADGVQAQAPVPEPTGECDVQVAAPVAISEEPVVLVAMYSERVGESLSAALQEESGVQLLSAEVGPAEQTVSLTLNTSQALPGEWTLSLTGENGECTGTFTVAAAEEPPAP